ncbi:MAG: DUF3810 domain-containing protein [Firmicutes bacterium]|nr:DUF3810 domain-containing protein [Bacillota bacterium]
MKRSKAKNIFYLTLSILLYFSNKLTTNWAQKNNAFIETFYSQGIYPYIAQGLNFLHRFFPFSLAEILFLLIGLEVFRRLVLFLTKPKEMKSFFDKNKIFNLLAKLALLLTALAFSFQLIWGLNYYRLPLSAHLDLDVKEREVDFLEEVLLELIDETNQLRLSLNNSMGGSSTLSLPLNYYYQELPKLYDNPKFKPDLPFLALPGSVKPIIFSGLMSFTKTSGFYFPFSGEANVNINVPDYQILATMVHEIAHRQGFAREDEANFLAWLVLRESDGPAELKYSGNMLALAYGLNAYHRSDPSGYSQIYNRLNTGVKTDFRFSRVFWARYEGPVETLSESINNQYLQSNKQRDGVKSYGRMLDLILAYYDKHILP